MYVYFQDNEWWLTEAFDLHNFLATHRGKSAEVFNMLRGLKFKKDHGKSILIKSFAPLPKPSFVQVPQLMPQYVKICKLRDLYSPLLLSRCFL